MRELVSHNPGEEILYKFTSHFIDSLAILRYLSPVVDLDPVHYEGLGENNHFPLNKATSRTILVSCEL